MRVSARVGVYARVGVSAQGCGKKAHTVRRLRPLRQGWAICPALFAPSNMRYRRGLYHGLHCCTSAPRRSVLGSNWPIYNCEVSFIVFIENGRQYPHIQTGPRTNHTRPNDRNQLDSTSTSRVFFVSPRAVGVCVVVLFVVHPLLQQYHTIHCTTHEVLLQRMLPVICF